MKPQPRPRKPVTIPKAGGPDPATLTAPGISQSSTASNGATASRGSEMKQLNIRVPAELAGRARTAWRVLMADGTGQPYSTFSGWVADLIEQAVMDAEERYNNGKPFNETSAGQLPLGRAPS
ncbi:hypothetical protein [Actinomyces succiniciruminis]|uniref:Centromere-binding protein ParB C-terminal domain-containing protein n=1 Tax=Actinomyces succiniciruminis TaxID=1522002 RepID=A0A1L7RPP1_9ACTO|nr:hypothetical protein [Actinomyces succiniciruminis]CED91314.1 Hypothetical protein AAM4_1482 [Actinomyces succiniciruminis]